MRVHMFADEAGDFNFTNHVSASEYLILTTVTTANCDVGDRLLDLRRQLAWENVEQASPDFHATEESQRVRDRVFDVLKSCEFRIDATILQKRKAQDHLRSDDLLFYKMAWYLHFKFVAPRVVDSGDELLIIAASLGTKRRRSVFHQAVRDVAAQTSLGWKYRTSAWAGSSDPCLWVADYCSWAIQRKWERKDDRSYVLIKDKIRSEFAPFRNSTTNYY
jgi:hypothetical protein